MPMQLLRRVSVIMNVDTDLLAFPQTEQGTGEFAVVEGGGNDVVWCKLDKPVGDPDRMIGVALLEYRNGRRGCGMSLGSRQGRTGSGKRRGRAQFQKGAAIHGHALFSSVETASSTYCIRYRNLIVNYNVSIR